MPGCISQRVCVCVGVLADFLVATLPRETALALIHAAKDGSLNVALQETVFASKELKQNVVRNDKCLHVLPWVGTGSILQHSSEHVRQM